MKVISKFGIGKLVLIFLLVIASSMLFATNTSNYDASSEYLLRVTSDDPNVPAEFTGFVQFTTKEGYTSPIEIPLYKTPHEGSFGGAVTINFWLNSANAQKMNVQLIYKSKNKEEIVASGHGVFVMLHASKTGDSFSTASNLS